ncbi:MAG: helix-turn-helix transcriptional regulator [Calditrichaeota bacterium]|nr:helix-turn-helix transcriptional regulator [Calditrichota bacterium]
MTSKEAFGNLLREMRIERNLSQNKLSELSGLSRTFIARLESGQRCPTIDSVFLLAKALEVRAGSLLDKIEKK